MARFRLRALFVLVAFAAVASFALNDLLQTRPPRQETYSTAKLQRLLNSGKTVLVTVDARWAVNPTDRPRFMSPEVSRRIRERNLTILTADWTSRTPQIDSLMRTLSENAVPTLAIFSPNAPDSPTVLSRHASDTEILEAIGTAMRPQSAEAR